MSSEQEWLSSQINIAWMATDLPADLPGEFAGAWDVLQGDPAWREWMTTHQDEVAGDDIFNMLQVEDRADVRVRFRRHKMVYYLPADRFRVADVEQASREVIREVYCARAERAGVPAPPPV